VHTEEKYRRWQKDNREMVRPRKTFFIEAIWAV
jgi:hypothetical protein